MNWESLSPHHATNTFIFLHTHACKLRLPTVPGGLFCDMTPACSILPSCWLHAWLFRPCSPRPARTASAPCARAIWPGCTACWDPAASPEPCAAEPDASSGWICPRLSNRIDCRFVSVQSCGKNKINYSSLYYYAQSCMLTVALQGLPFQYNATTDPTI